jgi:protein subunit release factor B
MNKEIEARLIELGARIEDVDERFILGSGHGGQKLQKTSSSVWLRHRPTGIEVRCQRERSQSANRQRAWNELCEKLEAYRREAAEKEKYEQERSRRRNRQKSQRQKVRMIQSKKHRAKTKSGRRKVGAD